MPKFVKVATRSQIPEGGTQGAVIAGKWLVLVKLQDEVYALEDIGPHGAGPLSKGQIAGEDIKGPGHRSCLHVKTGRAARDPSMENVATYRVRISGDTVEVEI